MLSAKGYARGILMKGQAGDTHGVAVPLSLIWSYLIWGLALFLTLHLWGLVFHLYK